MLRRRNRRKTETPVGRKAACGFDTEGNPSDSVLTVIAQSLTKTSGRCKSHYRNT